MLGQLSKFLRDERGQGFIEYTFIMILIAMAAMVAFDIFGQTVANSINCTASNLPN